MSSPADTDADRAALRPPEDRSDAFPVGEFVEYFDHLRNAGGHALAPVRWFGLGETYEGWPELDDVHGEGLSPPERFIMLYGNEKARRYVKTRYTYDPLAGRPFFEFLEELRDREDTDEWADAVYRYAYQVKFSGTDAPAPRECFDEDEETLTRLLGVISPWTDHRPASVVDVPPDPLAVTPAEHVLFAFGDAETLAQGGLRWKADDFAGSPVFRAVERVRRTVRRVDHYRLDDGRRVVRFRLFYLPPEMDRREREARRMIDYPDIVEAAADQFPPKADRLRREHRARATFGASSFVVDGDRVTDYFFRFPPLLMDNHDGDVVEDRLRRTVDSRRFDVPVEVEAHPEERGTRMVVPPNAKFLILKRLADGKPLSEPVENQESLGRKPVYVPQMWATGISAAVSDVLEVLEFFTEALAVTYGVTGENWTDDAMVS